jgi:hypothetical protein
LYVPTTIVYEDTLTNPQAAVDQVAQMFGLSGARRLGTPSECRLVNNVGVTAWRAKAAGA